MKLVPDLTTWRAPAVAAQDRARLLRRLHGGGRADRGGAALGAAPPARARGQGGLPGEDRVRARALPVPGDVRRGAGQALSRPHPGLELPRGLPHPPDVQGRAAGSRDPQRHGGGARAGGVLQGRVGAGAGGDQPPLRRRAGDGRPPRALQARGEGDRLPAGLLGDVHGQVRHGRGGLVLPPALLGVGSGRAAQPVRGQGRRPAGHAALPAVARRARWRWRASSRISTRRP